MGYFLSIITVNYNGLKDTLCLLDSLYSIITSVEFEVIVVDNGSLSDEAKKIKSAFPLCNVIRSEENLGFAGGNNLGVDVAKGDYLFFINNDTYIEEDNLKHLLSVFEKYPDTGGVSPLIRFAFPPQNIQFAGYTQLTAVTLRNNLIGFGEKPDARLLKPSYTPFLHGAAMILKREVIEQCGKMPELYFLYYEELDWCSIITRAGYKLRFEPSCTIFHKESRTTGMHSPLRTYYLTRNRMLYAWRNCNASDRYLSIIYQSFIVMPRDIVFSLIKGRFDISRAVLRGWKDFFKISNKQS